MQLIALLAQIVITEIKTHAKPSATTLSPSLTSRVLPCPSSVATWRHLHESHPFASYALLLRVNSLRASTRPQGLFVQLDEELRGANLAYMKRLDGAVKGVEMKERHGVCKKFAQTLVVVRFEIS